MGCFIIIWHKHTFLSINRSRKKPHLWCTFASVLSLWILQAKLPEGLSRWIEALEMTKFWCLSVLYFHSDISRIIFLFPTTMNLNKHRSEQSDQFNCFHLSHIQLKSLTYLCRAGSLRKSCALLATGHYGGVTGRNVSGLPSFQGIELSRWGVVFCSSWSLSINSASPACPTDIGVTASKCEA